MGMSAGKTIACVFAVCAVLAAGEGGARSGSHGGSHSSGGAHRGFAHHHHGHAVFFGGFFVGAPFWRPYPYYYPPYYYGPDYAARSEPPKVYVERFDGQPTPQTQGEIFCPSAGAYYPAVSDCPGGWQRVIRPEG
jgi:hypothetical protein